MRVVLPALRPTRWGVRRRSVLTAVVAVSLALLAGGVVLLVQLQSALVSTVSGDLTVRTSDVAVLIADEGLSVAASAVSQGRRGNQTTQIVAADGTVLASSDQRLTSALSPQHPPVGEVTVGRLTQLPAALGEPDDHLVAVRTVNVAGQEYRVQVAEPIQVQADTIRTVAIFLLTISPVIIALVALAVWVLVGQSLQSVERIRRQVAAIDSQRLTDRVAVPQTHDEIALLAATMNTMLERLHASDVALHTFLSDASHELRSPVSTLLTASEVAALDPTGQHWRDVQPIVLSEARRMQRMVEDLLTLAKADAAALVTDRVEVDLDDVLDGEVRRLRATSPHTINTHLQPVRVLGDAGRLVQVFRNLLDNASRHAATCVALLVEVEGDRVVVEVDNDGPPVEPAQRAVIFERFARLEESRHRDSGGSGLGLAIAAEIVRLHSGTITVGVNADGWCRFTVTLPLQAAG